MMIAVPWAYAPVYNVWAIGQHLHTSTGLQGAGERPCESPTHLLRHCQCQVGSESHLEYGLLSPA
jgi:hypothetical protein